MSDETSPKPNEEAVSEERDTRGEPNKPPAPKLKLVMVSFAIFLFGFSVGYFFFDCFSDDGRNAEHCQYHRSGAERHDRYEVQYRAERFSR